MLQNPKIKKRYSKTLKKELKGDLLMVKGTRRRQWSTPRPLKAKSKQLKRTRSK